MFVRLFICLFLSLRPLESFFLFFFPILRASAAGGPSFGREKLGRWDGKNGEPNQTDEPVFISSITSTALYFYPVLQVLTDPFDLFERARLCFVLEKILGD